MKNKVGLLGLLGIPLAMLGIVRSVAFAQTNIPPTSSAPQVQTAQQATDTEVAGQEAKDSATDTDNVQFEDASGTDTGGATDTDNVQSGDTTGADTANEAPEAPGTK